LKDEFMHPFIELDLVFILRGLGVKLLNEFFCLINIFRLPNISNLSILRVEIYACLLLNGVSGIQVLLE